LLLARKLVIPCITASVAFFGVLFGFWDFGVRHSVGWY